MAVGDRTLLRVDKLSSLGRWVGATPIPMTGRIDLSTAAGGGLGDVLSIEGPPIAVAGSSDVRIRYSCGGANLEARVGLGSMGTFSSLVGYDYQRDVTVPRAAVSDYAVSAGMDVTHRVAVSPPFTRSDGVTRRWAVKWDAGRYVVDGSRPSWRYPSDGSPLTVFSYPQLE
jgi:hypothetical protein